MDRKQVLDHRQTRKTSRPEQHSPAVKTVDPALIQRAIEDPETLTPETAEALQQTHGNRFVSSLVQHRAGADMALQRQPLEEEEELMQMKRDEMALQRQPMEEEEELIQPKRDETALQRQPMEEEEELLQPKRDETALQRQPLEEEEELMQMKRRAAALQRQSHADGFDLDADTANRINSARSGGQTLGQSVQAQYSQAMGFDFSGVRVHSDSEADSLNTAVQARAFTTGQDIFFKQGEYNPGSSGGQELLTHELTHVVQQSTGQVPSGGGGMTVRPAGDAYEQEADAMAQQVTSQGFDQPSEGQMQRQEEADSSPFEESLQRSPDQRGIRNVIQRGPLGRWWVSVKKKISINKVLGGNAYIWTDRGATPDQLILSSHGGYAKGDDDVTVPSPIKYYSIRNDPTALQLGDIKGRQRGMAEAGDDVPDYALSKYQGKHGGGAETYMDIGNWLKDNPGYAVLTVKGGKEIKYSQLTGIMGQYSVVHGLHCRVLVDAGPQAEYFSNAPEGAIKMPGM